MCRFRAPLLLPLPVKELPQRHATCSAKMTGVAAHIDTCDLGARNGGVVPQRAVNFRFRSAAQDRHPVTARIRFIELASLSFGVPCLAWHCRHRPLPSFSRLTERR
jgi:hypothetical protein